MQPIIVRGLSIGTGRPKIIVPILGETLPQLLAEAQQVLALPADLVEWRMDWFERTDGPQVLEAAAALRRKLGERPILATFRTAEEGGRRAIERSVYGQLVCTLAQSGLVDLLDIELSAGEELVRELTAFCQSNGVKVVLSHHDFAQTPPKEEMIALLARMEALGADLAKLAVMPCDPGDLLALLSATWERSRRAEKPLVTMSMGTLGAVSRISGEIFGSALTFGTAARASAPGQVEAGRLLEVLDMLRQA